jgi:DNA (cytosine-5)-methyltransferase 1
MLTHFSLFTGIGGADLAAEWAGFESIGQVEWADYPTKVLEKHWPNVPRWRDIRDVSSDNIRPIIGDKGITVLSGGFPCQPFSVAGKQKGEDDDRFLWPEMLRVIHELQPTWVIGENVPGIVNMALEQVCTNLEDEGYEVQPFIIPAAGVNALHRRKRVFILGYSKHNGLAAIKKLRCDEETSNKWGSEEQKTSRQLEGTDRPINVSSLHRCETGIKQHDTNSNSKMLEGQWQKSSRVEQEQRDISHGSWWESEPNVGRVANGIPSRVDRLKCLGNAIVPQQIYPIFRYIAEIENSKQK